jgi:hypothetical protein
MGDGVFNNTLDHTLEGEFRKYHDCMLKKGEYAGNILENY